MPHFNFAVITTSPQLQKTDFTSYVIGQLGSPGSPDKYVSSQKMDINGTQWLKVRSVKDYISSEPGDYNYFQYRLNDRLYWMYFYGALSTDLEKIPFTFKFTK